MRRTETAGTDDAQGPLSRQVRIVNGKKKVEGAQAFEAFSEYVRLSTIPGEKRSLTALSKKIGKNVSLLKRWSAAWDWKDRARAIDDELSASILEGLRDRKLRALRQELIAADSLLSKALKALQETDSSDLGPRDIASFIDLASKLIDRIYGEIEPDGGENGKGGKVGPLTIADLIAQDEADDEGLWSPDDQP